MRPVCCGTNLPGEHVIPLPAAPTGGSTITSVSSSWPPAPMRPTTASTRTSSGVNPARFTGAQPDRPAAEHGAAAPARVDEVDPVPHVLDLGVPPRRSRIFAKPSCRIAVKGPVGGIVELAHVLVHHALAVELAAQVHDRLLHAPHPLARHALGPALVVHRHDLVFEQRVDGAGVDFVLVLRVRDPGRRWPSRRTTRRPRRTSRPGC